MENFVLLSSLFDQSEKNNVDSKLKILNEKKTKIQRIVHFFRNKVFEIFKNIRFFHFSGVTFCGEKIFLYFFNGFFWFSWSTNCFWKFSNTGFSKSFFHNFKKTFLVEILKFSHLKSGKCTKPFPQNCSKFYFQVFSFQIFGSSRIVKFELSSTREKVYLYTVNQEDSI